MGKSKTLRIFAALSAMVLVVFIANLTLAKLEPKDKPLSEVRCVCVGSIDHNLVIDQRDVDLMQAIIQGKKAPTEPTDCGDVNGNGFPFEIADAILLNQMVDQYGSISCK